MSKRALCFAAVIVAVAMRPVVASGQLKHGIGDVPAHRRARDRAPSTEIVVVETSQGSAESGLLDDVEPLPTTPYEIARQLAINGQWNDAEAFLSTALTNEPNNSDLHRLRAEIAYYYYKDLGHLEARDVVAEHAVRAFELALGNHALDFRAADLVADVAASVKEPAVLDALFESAATYDDSGRIAFAHARALATLGSPSAEAVWRRAASFASEGNTEAVEMYAEWLLDSDRPSDAVALLARFEQSVTNPYVHFLRGVALERDGDAPRASTEYARYASFSAEYPAPSRLRILGSAAQANAGIHFRDEYSPDFSVSTQQFRPPVTNALTISDAQKGLSYLIYGEAAGESMGGKRAEGWVVRNRVLRGSVYNDAGQSCPYVTNAGSGLPDQYKTVMCQGNGAQFNGMCIAWCSNASTTTCKENADTKAAATDVYNGYAPDPVGGHCPNGFLTSGALCNSSTRCKGNSTSFRLAGGLFNYAKASGATCPTLCAGAGVGKTCSNGGYDNCFYANTRYARSGVTTYSATFTASGQTGYTPAFTASAGTQTAHLEGPENSANPDFDLSLQKSCGSNCWTTVKSSARLGTVEDLVYSNSAAATYRWRIVAYQGTGFFRLYTVRP